MKNLIFKIISLIFLFLISILVFLSVKGVETKRFNNQISQKIENINKDLKIELDKVNIILDPFALKIKAKTIGPEIQNNKKAIGLESIETSVSINSLIKNEFSLTDLKISTKSLEMKNLISFLRLFKNSPELYVFDLLLPTNLYVPAAPLADVFVTVYVKILSPIPALNLILSLVFTNDAYNATSDAKLIKSTV